MLHVYTVKITVILIANLHSGDGWQSALTNQLARQSKLFLQDILLW